jgi:hypothetical protein
MTMRQVVRYRKRQKKRRVRKERLGMRKYDIVVGLRKALYVFGIVVSVAVTGMVQSGELKGPEDLGYPLLAAVLATGADMMRNYVKVKKGKKKGGVKMLPVVLLGVMVSGWCVGCAVSTTRFEERANEGTADELVTVYRGWTITPPFGERESANLVWSYELKGGDSRISTGQEEKGTDNTGQVAGVDALGALIGDALSKYFSAQAAYGKGPLDVLREWVPVLLPGGVGGVR